MWPPKDARHHVFFVHFLCTEPPLNSRTLIKSTAHAAHSRVPAVVGLLSIFSYSVNARWCHAGQDNVH